ncbi:MAG: biopolymer transporter ExbD [Planctomycetes bacterium]|nr:biopolymer transporter ExbD [Planctomycetota bacterium]
MSHSSRSDTTCEPNLTPLLDLVLQILMFFMVTVNFAQDQQQVSANVKLPDSETARPLSKAKDRDPIFLNLQLRPVEGGKPEYVVEVPSVDTSKGMTPQQREAARFMSQDNAKIWLQGKFLDLKRDNKNGEVTNSIIIRADKDAEYAEVFRLLGACSEAGFRTLKVRARVIQ